MWSSQKGPTRLWDLRIQYLLFSFIANYYVRTGEPLTVAIDRPDGMPKINSLEVMCGKDHMDVHLSFSAPFDGIVSSKGQHSDPRCIYVPPSSGKTFYAFRIAYARCGTKPDLNGQFYENTVVIQYDKDLLEVWDEAKRLRCEWFNDYEKTASKPPMVIADLDVIQLDFRGDNVDCWMEIQSGKGPWAPPVSGIVPIGSTLTLVVAINDFRGEFDMRVKSCVASDGGGHVIKLSDEYGCVLRPKMISRFLKARAPDEKATVITYAFFHAFKFPDALSVHIKCKVEICRHGCLDHCQATGSNERRDVIEQELIEPAIEHDHNQIGVETSNTLKNPIDNDSEDIDDEEETSFYEEIAEAVGLKPKNNEEPLMQSAEKQQQQQAQNGPLVQQHEPIRHLHRTEPQAQAQVNELTQEEVNEQFSSQQQQQQQQKQQHQHQHQQQQQHQQKHQYQQQTQPPHSKENVPEIPEVHEVNEESIDDILPNDPPMHEMLRKTYLELKKTQEEKFPQGPRTIKDRMGLPPPVAGPRSLNLGEEIRPSHRSTFVTANRTYRARHRRSIVVSDRKARSADIGVTGNYDVISEADLAFSPREGKQEAVTVFQGKISDDVVYGICMPVPGFSVLFILVTSATVVSALIAGSLLYRYQLQKAAFEAQQQTNMNPNTFASWMTLRLFRMNHVCENVAAPSDSNKQPPK